MMIRKWSLGVVLPVVLALILTPALVSAQEKVIKIGALYPMTGRAGLYGLDSVDAAEMAVADINA